MANNSILSISPKKILVCQLRQIGDVILTTPAIQLLHEKFPQAKIYLYTEKKCAHLLEHNPHIYKIIPLDKKKLKNFWDEVKFYYQVAKHDFDLIIDFQQLPRSRFVALFSKAKIKLTYTPPWYNRLFYTHWTNSLPGYAVYSKLSILRLLGIQPQIIKPQIYLTPEEIAWAKDYLTSLTANQYQIITFDPTHRRITRRWPTEHYALLGKLIGQKFPFTKIFLLYGPGEFEVAQKIYSSDPNVFILPQKILSLREMAAIIHQASLHIGNCSAPRHIAVALDTPSLIILGATSSSWTYPDPKKHKDISLGLACQPCNQNTCPHVNCLKQLTPEQVLSQSIDWIKTILTPSD
ncbi:MAG: glycosyltransferase family 9 protein [Desulfonauticus sp.]|nr:glycosyltransferase family 9 protein [Desulfonauticus sp.]